jgi:hypothetical protein
MRVGRYSPHYIKINSQYNMKKLNIIFFLLPLLIFASISKTLADGLILQGSVSEMYDDNINNSNDNPETDYITNLTLGLGVKLEGKTQTLQLLGHINQQLYYKNSSLNNNAQDLILNYIKEFSSRDKFTLNDTFQHYPEPRDFSAMYGQPAGRNSYYTNLLSLAFDKDLISDFSINLHYANEITRVSGGTANNSMSNSAGSALNYSFNAFNIAFIFYDYKITKYESGNGNGNGQENNTQHTAGVGYQHFFTKQLSLTSRVGFNYIKSQDDTQYAPYFLLSIIDTIDENNTINISVTRSYQTTLLTDTVYDSWIFSALFTRQVSARMTFSLSTFYQYGTIVSSLSNEESSLFGLNTFVNYYLNENIFVSAKYTYTKASNKQTNPSSSKSEYDRNQIELSANAAY